MAKGAEYSARDVALARSLRREGKSFGWIASLMEAPKSTIYGYCNGRRRNPNPVSIR